MQGPCYRNAMSALALILVATISMSAATFPDTASDDFPLENFVLDRLCGQMKADQTLSNRLRNVDYQRDGDLRYLDQLQEKRQQDLYEKNKRHVRHFYGLMGKRSIGDQPSIFNERASFTGLMGKRDPIPYGRDLNSLNPEPRLPLQDKTYNGDYLFGVPQADRDAIATDNVQKDNPVANRMMQAILSTILNKYCGKN
ncbi:tachykinin [Ciona intestinalis]